MLEHLPPIELAELVMRRCGETTHLRFHLLKGGTDSQASGGASFNLDVETDKTIPRQPYRAHVIPSAQPFPTAYMNELSKRNTNRQPLVIAPYISPQSAQQCRQMNLSFMDAAGNAHLRGRHLFVWTVNHRLPKQERPAAPYRAFTPVGLRIAFALLTRPQTLDATYRDIAAAAGVSLSMVGSTLDDLHQRGYLSAPAAAPRRLIDAARLRADWAIHYPAKLRPKLKPRRYSSAVSHWWRTTDIAGYDAWWGGEVAAEKLTNYLRAEQGTLYMRGPPNKLLLDLRLRPDPHGQVEILDAFWAKDTPLALPGVVPPLLAYADLLASSDPRNQEAAQDLRRQYEL